MAVVRRRRPPVKRFPLDSLSEGLAEGDSVSGGTLHVSGATTVPDSCRKGGEHATSPGR